MAKYIPDQTFVGSRGKFNTVNPPLAFLTPYGEDYAAKKKN